MTQEELNKILKSHELWLKNDIQGERANLSNADLAGVDLCYANLSYADLRGVNLSNANLTCANLSYADLRRANLNEARLNNTDMRCANLNGVNLNKAYLCGAKLSDVNYNANTAFFVLQCPERGAFIGFKKCGDYIVELEITDDALRSSATTRKCRCSKAKVLSITNLDGSKSNLMNVASDWDEYFIYKIGEIVEVNDFDENRWNECSTGIHFFITRDEAVRY